jgi:hypothetical protein
MPIKTWDEFKADATELFSWTNIKYYGLGWFFQNLENLLDDPIDWVKEKIHGAHLPFGYAINISVLMKNRKPSTWDIIRKQGDYPNSDPEDLEG